MASSEKQHPQIRRIFVKLNSKLKFRFQMPHYWLLEKIDELSLIRGDQLLRINNVDVQKLSPEELLKTLHKHCNSTAILDFVRIPCIAEDPKIKIDSSFFRTINVSDTFVYYLVVVGQRSF